MDGNKTQPSAPTKSVELCITVEKTCTFRDAELNRGTGHEPKPSTWLKGLRRGNDAKGPSSNSVVATKTPPGRNTRLISAI